MLSIGKRNLNSKRSAFEGGGELSFVNRMIRPVMRRVQRSSSDILSGHICLPAHIGSVATFAFFAGVLTFGTYAGGHSESTLRHFTSAIGFSVHEVKVSGNSETSDIDILQELGLDESSSLITLDLTKAHQQLSSLPWVQKVELSKVYPATLHVKLSERKAFAIWQHGDQLSLIEKDGNVIENYEGFRQEGLPLFVGLGAETHAAEIDTILNEWPEVKKQTKAIIRVADRRWDLRLENGVTLNLPEKNVGAALAHLESLNQSQDILRRDIAEIDLRLEDRVTIRLTQEALERRNEALAERAKILKKRKNT